MTSIAPDTIAALATPPGESALAIIRISGPRALTIANRLFHPAGAAGRDLLATPSHQLRYGHLVDDGHRLDEVMLAVLRAPRTFTREDMVEIHTHGNPQLVQRVLQLLARHGARPAAPGEFTRRAFLNGRIDLAQAEAVADFIRARTDRALESAREQLEGRLSERVGTIRDGLMTALAHVEAHIDFPDEDIAPDTRDRLLNRLADAGNAARALLATAAEGRVLRHGLRIAIVGAPNAGKSSLLNQLLGHERAIVSPQPGTTRDTIEETASIRDLPVVFTDTAGLRPTADPVEGEGMRRSRRAIARSDLVLHVLDVSLPLAPEDAELLHETASLPRLLVLNKTDLPPPHLLSVPASTPPATPTTLAVSCLTGEGLDALRDRIAAHAVSGGTGTRTDAVTVNARHHDALRRALQALDEAQASLDTGRSLEIVALDLRIATAAIGEIIGRTSTEDLLDSIFSQFCLGK